MAAPDAPRLVLASQSPRRADYLRMLGIDFSVQPADIDESVLPGEAASPHVERLAREKAEAAARIVAGLPPDSDADPPLGAYVLAGDTVVVLQDEILGKPRDTADAADMLMRLQGQDHVVASGMALRTPAGVVHSGVSETVVHFREFDRATAEAYAATGEPLDKAGAYGIQGLGAAVVEAIRGDYYTVVGLPIPLMLRLFAAAGWSYRFGEWSRAE